MCGQLEVVARCPNLTHLRLPWYMGDAALARLCDVASVQQSLQVLHLSKPRSIPNRLPHSHGRSMQARGGGGGGGKNDSIADSIAITDRGLLQVHRLRALKELHLENSDRLTDRGLLNLLVMSEETQPQQLHKLQRTLSPSQSLMHTERQRKLREQVKDCSFLTPLAQRLTTLNLCNAPITALSIAKVRHAAHVAHGVLSKVTSPMTIDCTTAITGEPGYLWLYARHRRELSPADAVTNASSPQDGKA